MKVMLLMYMTLGLTPALLPAGETNKIACSFGKGGWNPSEWMFVKRRDMSGRSEWRQDSDFIANDGTHTSMVFTKKHKGDIKVSVSMAFVDRMAPSIVIVSKLGTAADGANVFDEHVEIVLWDEGVNIWHLHTVDGKSLWELSAFAKFKLTKNNPYTLEAVKRGKELSVRVDGHVFGYRDSTLPEEYYVGITGSEGVNRFYSFAVQDAQELK